MIIDHLVNLLPFWVVVQGLHGTDPTQEKMSETMQILRLPPGSMSWTIADQEHSCPAWQNLDHAVRIDDLSDVWRSLIFVPTKL